MNNIKRKKRRDERREREKITKEGQHASMLKAHYFINQLYLSKYIELKYN